MDKPEIAKAFCNNCKQQTKHFVIVKRVTRDEVPEGDTIYWEDRYNMLECCGCGTCSLKQQSFFSEEPGIETRYYPPRIARPLPLWRWTLPQQIGDILNEVYVALQADCRALALMGARAIMDLVMVDKVGDVGTFAQKLEELERQGFVGTQNRLFLDAALDAGSAAAHRGYTPESEDINHVMDIIENLLQGVYALEKAAQRLRRSTPPRNR